MSTSDLHSIFIRKREKRDGTRDALGNWRLEEGERDEGPSSEPLENRKVRTSLSDNREPAQGEEAARSAASLLGRGRRPDVRRRVRIQDISEVEDGQDDPSASQSETAREGVSDDDQPAGSHEDQREDGDEASGPVQEGGEADREPDAEDAGRAEAPAADDTALAGQTPAETQEPSDEHTAHQASDESAQDAEPQHGTAFGASAFWGHDLDYAESDAEPGAEKAGPASEASQGSKAAAAQNTADDEEPGADTLLGLGSFVTQADDLSQANPPGGTAQGQAEQSASGASEGGQTDSKEPFELVDLGDVNLGETALDAFDVDFEPEDGPEDSEALADAALEGARRDVEGAIEQDWSIIAGGLKDASGPSTEGDAAGETNAILGGTGHEAAASAADETRSDERGGEDHDDPADRFGRLDSLASHAEGPEPEHPKLDGADAEKPTDPEARNETSGTDGDDRTGGLTPFGTRLFAGSETPNPRADDGATTPAQSSPTQSSPTQSSSAQSEPAQSEPAQSATASSAPRREPMVPPGAPSERTTPIARTIWVQQTAGEDAPAVSPSPASETETPQNTEDTALEADKLVPDVKPSGNADRPAAPVDPDDAADLWPDFEDGIRVRRAVPAERTSGPGAEPTRANPMPGEATPGGAMSGNGMSGNGMSGNPAARGTGPATAGTVLRDARIAAGKDLAEISAALRIRYKHLDALERSDFAALPAKPYAVGFVRAYAEHLGLNPDQLVRQFKSELGEPAAPMPPPPRSADFGFPATREEPRLPTGITMAVLVLLILGGGAGWYFSRSPLPTVAEVVPEPPLYSEADTRLLRPPPSVPRANVPPAPAALGQTQPNGAAPADGDAPAPGTQPLAPQRDAQSDALGGAERTDPAVTPDRAEAPVIAQTDPQAAPAQGPSGNAPAGAPSTLAPTAGQPPADAMRLLERFDAPPMVRVEILAVRRAWLRIENASGKVVVQDELVPGELLRVPQEKGLILVARDGGAFEMIVDGDPVGKAGRSGEVLRGISLDANELREQAANRR